MSDTKILQAILDGQTSIRADITSIRTDVKRVEKKVDGGFEKVNGRLDKIGLSVASLEDDTPTIEEFDNLDKRVKKLEKQVASS